MSVENAIAEIRNCTTEQELGRIVEALKLQRQFISMQNIRSVAVGDDVQFTARGREIKGTVIKVNRKNVKVLEEGYGTWNVPASLLTVIKQEA